MKKDYSKRTKIVVTIGPAVSTKEDIIKLIKAGANVFRLNTSHGSMDDHREKFKSFIKARKKTVFHDSLFSQRMNYFVQILFYPRLHRFLI